MTIRILIPVLRRPHNVAPLLQSIRQAATVPYAVTFICSPGDTDQIAACKATDADTIVVPWKPGKADFAKKINLAYVNTTEEWLFQAADDVCFHHGWDTHALNQQQRNRVGVVGTNDLGNPLVKRGHHSTHTLFSRHYIQTYGGTHDNTGEVFCELYDHQYTDTEFVQTAIIRQQFTFAAKAVVEHLHPHWDKGQMDATYDKATRATDDDRRLYQSRIRTLSTRAARAQARARRRQPR